MKWIGFVLLASFAGCLLFYFLVFLRNLPTLWNTTLDAFSLAAWDRKASATGIQPWISSFVHAFWERWDNPSQTYRYVDSGSFWISRHYNFIAPRPEVRHEPSHQPVRPN